MKWAVKVIQIFNVVYDWLTQKDCLGNQRSATILIGSFLVFGVVNEMCPNSNIVRIMAYLFVILIIVMIGNFIFDPSRKVISKVTKNTCSTPRELLKKFGHISYGYGLFFFSMETCYLVEMFIFLTTNMINNEPYIVNIINLWICCMFVYTFLYFTYHIYFASSKKKIEIIKQTLQLYAALGTTISFLMLLFGESRGFKIFVTGTMLEYTWLQYFITKELNTVQDINNYESIQDGIVKMNGNSRSLE